MNDIVFNIEDPVEAMAFLLLRDMALVQPDGIERTLETIKKVVDDQFASSPDFTRKLAERFERYAKHMDLLNS